jgi:hypothetical protein
MRFKNKIIQILAVTVLVIFYAVPSQAYLMQKLKYEDLFAQADYVVIATPIKSHESTIQLEVGQPNKVKQLITTIDTVFEIGYIIKGSFKNNKFHLLHLNRKDRNHTALPFGAVGTFFIDFKSEKHKNKSFILFLKKDKMGNFIPAWNIMEGSRAIISIPKDGFL